MALATHSFLDGEHDWMDPVGGLQALENLRLAGNENGRMFVVPNAGHHGKDTIHHNILGLIGCILLH